MTAKLIDGLALSKQLRSDVAQRSAALKARGITPGLAVDQRGVRLGQGGGCYDRALLRRGTGVKVVTVLHDAELVPSLPSEPHDLPVDGVLRPSGVTWF